MICLYSPFADNKSDASSAARDAYVLISLLRILRANLNRLIASGVDPYSVGVEVLVASLLCFPLAGGGGSGGASVIGCLLSIATFAAFCSW